MSKKIEIINGPNINLLGKREPDIYGNLTLESINSNGNIINAAAFTHTSVAIHAALKSLNIPKIEVHISNIYKREEFRHKSLISNVVDGVICGLGANSYKLALKGIKYILDGN